MKIDILCNDGSPIGVTLEDVWGDGLRGIGVGGAEYALLTMCETWHKLGHDVTVYNRPLNPNGSPWCHKHTSQFEPQAARDVLIIFRSPNPLSIGAKGFKVWWSCDQMTVGDYAAFAGTVDKIVCISQFHADYFVKTYRINNVEVIDLPIRLDDLVMDKPIEKIPKRCIFTSIPDRGLFELWNCWGAIKERVPEASLVITSDYRLWGVRPQNQQHIDQWQGKEDVRFMGAIKRSQLIKEQLLAEYMPYPCTYDELFCISVAEAQCCGIYTITSDTGSLPTTNMCKVVPRESTRYLPVFTDVVVEALNTKVDTRDLKLKAFARFEPDIIAKQWDTKIFKGV